MTQENTTAELSILPKGNEKREIFYNRLNDWIDQYYLIEAAKDVQKDIMNAIAEDFVSVNDGVKPADVKKRAKLMIEEHLAGKATEEAVLIEDVLGDTEIAAKHLKG